MTEIYFRVMRDGSAQTVEMERLTPQERESLLSRKGHEFTIDCLDRACECLIEFTKFLEGLEKAGVLKRTEDEPRPMP